MRSSSLWKNHDFRIVFGGGLVNNIGDWFLLVALPAFVYTQTESGRSTAIIVVIELLVGIVFGPYGGALADRWDLRRTVVATNVLQAVTLLPLLIVTSDRLWPAFLVAALQGLLQQVNNPASFALVPRIVPTEQLVQANAANAASSSIARLVGAPLGGIVVALGGLSAVVAVDAATFAVVALATWFVRTSTESLSSGDDTAKARSSLLSGWNEIRQHRALVGLLGVQMLSNLAFAMFPVLFIAFVIDILHGNEATVGIVRGTAAAGGLAASVIVGRNARNIDPARLMLWGYTGLGAVAFLFVNIAAVSTALWLFLVIFGMTGLPNMTSQIGAVGAVQRLCPPALLGRFQGLASAMGSVGAVIGSIVVGLLLDRLGVTLLLNVQATLFVLSGIASYVLVIRHQPLSADS